jgi:pentatricopeptide repeat domain-containing protein 1
VLLRLCRKDELRNADSAAALRGVLTRMLERGAAPEVLHYNAAMARARQLRDPKLAASLFDELLKDDALKPDVYSFSAAIGAADRDWRRALALLDGMAREHGCAPDVVCFTAAVSACGKAGQAAHALALYERMLAAKVEPNAYTYSALVSACDKAGRAEDALRLVPRLSLSLSLILCLFVKPSFFCSALPWNLQLETDHLDCSLASFPHFCLSTCNGFVRCGGGLKQVAASRAAGLEPAPFVWASAVSACGKAGQPDLALAALKDHCLGTASRPLGCVRGGGAG